MDKSFPVSFASLAALLLAGSALAQTIPGANPSGVDADRVDRRCTSTTLSTDASAPCADDVLNDGLHVSPVVIRPPNSTVGNDRTSAGTNTQSAPGNTGTTSTGPMGNTGAGSTGTSMGTTGMPSTGTASTPARR